jgi:hypothetical protein
MRIPIKNRFCFVFLIFKKQEARVVVWSLDNFNFKKFFLGQVHTFIYFCEISLHLEIVCLFTKIIVTCSISLTTMDVSVKIRYHMTPFINHSDIHNFIE